MFYGGSCPQQYGLSVGTLGYGELIDGVNKVEWLDENTLRVTAIIYINCVLGLKDAGYTIEGNTLNLLYDQTDIGPDEQLVACACPHEAIYIVYNLEKKDYDIQLGWMK